MISLHGVIEVSSENDLKRKFPDKNITDIIVNVELTSVDLSSWTFTNVVFKQGSIANANFTSSTFLGKPGRTVFTSKLSCAIFVNARLENVTFLEKIADCNFSNAQLKNVKFRDEVSECDFSNAILDGVSFKGDFFNNNAIGATLTNCVNKDGNLIETQYGRLILAKDKK
jgi:uncharacterized protein YjbI with pentapeptide repeats